MKGFHRHTPVDVLPPILTSLREALDKTINGEDWKDTLRVRRLI